LNLNVPGLRPARYQRQGQLMTVDTEIIRAFYEKHLRRAPDADGLEHFRQYDSPVDVERAIVASEEFKRGEQVLRIPDMPVAWKICIIEEAKLVFVPIAKNAHTSILTAFLRFRGIDWRTLPILDELDAAFGTEEDKVHAALVANNTGLLLKDLSPGRVDEVLGNPEYLRVAVFRDPLDRIVSACNHFFVQEAANPMAQRHSRQVVEAFAGASDVDLRKAGSPCEFWLRRLMKFLISNRDVTPDAHWMPQYEYVKALRIDHILPVERLDVLEKMVASRSGRPLSIGKLNVRADATANRHDGIDKKVRDLVEEYYWLDRHFYEMAKANIDTLDRQFSG
jgi:hypothetical protein